MESHEFSINDRVGSCGGAVFESFVLSEPVKNYTNRGQELVPIEIKSGQAVPSDFFGESDYRRGLVADPEAPAALVYGGDRSFRRRGVTVYSWKTL